MSSQNARQAAVPAAPPTAGPQRPAPGETTGYVELAALPLTPYWARRHAQAVLGAWQVSAETIETATLLVSELITNAVAATTAYAAAAGEQVTSGLIVQTLRRQHGRIVIEVSDSDPSPPVLTDAGTDAEYGRGLMLVQALSKEWSYFFPPSGGKVIYCMLYAPDDATTEDSLHAPTT